MHIRLNDTIEIMIRNENGTYATKRGRVIAKYEMHVTHIVDVDDEDPSKFGSLGTGVTVYKVGFNVSTDPRVIRNEYRVIDEYAFHDGYAQLIGGDTM